MSSTSAALLGEVHRVLKPGGQLAGGDWMKGPEPYSADMIYFIELEGIPYHPITLAEYGVMLHEIGFERCEAAGHQCLVSRPGASRSWRG